MTNLRKMLGDKIRLLRKEKKWTQERLAERADLNLNTLQRYETGLAWPRPNNIKKLAMALDVEEKKLMSLAAPHENSEEGILKRLDNIENRLNPQSADNLLLKEIRAISKFHAEVVSLLKQIRPNQAEVILYQVLAFIKANLKQTNTKGEAG